MCVCVPSQEIYNVFVCVNLTNVQVCVCQPKKCTMCECLKLINVQCVCLSQAKKCTMCVCQPKKCTMCVCLSNLQMYVRVRLAGIEMYNVYVSL